MSVFNLALKVRPKGRLKIVTFLKRGKLEKNPLLPGEVTTENFGIWSNPKSSRISKISQIQNIEKRLGALQCLQNIGK